MYGKELFVWFYLRVFHEHLSISVCSSFLCSFLDGMWDLTVIIPDHCLSIYFSVYFHITENSVRKLNESGKTKLV